MSAATAAFPESGRPHGAPSNAHVAMGHAMKLFRRQFLHLAAGTATLPVMSRLARAEAYPTRPVRIIVGFGPGGVGDIIARLIGQWLSERLGQQFVIENRPGAGTNIATEAVARAVSDGYTLLQVSGTNAYNATLYPGLNFNFIRDFAPVASIARVPVVMEVNPLFPAKTLPEFIAYAKANPGKANMGVIAGGATHLYGELFKMMARVDMVPVYYRGPAPALTDLIAGQVHVMFDPLVSSIEHIRAGKLRALAVTSAKRSEALPDVPTVADFVPGYEASGWDGIAAPKNTPAQIIDTLNKEVNAALGDAKFKARLADLGSTPMSMTAADFGKFIADETEKWAKVIRAANIKVE
jgi:tripartite-type tricarboxylate transporter receptor subunit TctC